MTTVASTAVSKSLLQELAAIHDSELRKQSLAARKSELDLEMIVEIANQARGLLRVDARQSLSLGELAIDIAKLLGSEVGTAHAVRIKANALHALGQYVAAVGLHKEAIRLFEAGGEVEEVGRTLSASIL